MYQGDLDKFLLFFAATGSNKCTEEIRRLGCNQLLSQLNERGEANNWIEFLRANPDYPGKLFIDSGAYSAYTKGKEIDIDDYIDFINDTGDTVFIYAEVDKIPQVIGREPTEEEFSAAAQISWDNYLYMIEHVKPEYRDKIMPVFHFQEDTKWLVNMLEYTFEDGHHIPYIGLAVSTIDNARVRYNWLEMCFKIIKNSSNPDVMTHAFGLTALDVLERVPLTSSDSTTWVISSSHGSILLDKKVIDISDRTLHHSQNFINKNIGLKEVIAEKVKKYGFTVDELSKDYIARQFHNIRYLKEWQDTYKYRGNMVFTEDLF